MQTRQGLIAGIKVALELKFGETGLALLPEVRQIENVELLRVVFDSIKQAEGPESLRHLWSKP